jgi:hypothetical protein
MVASLPVWNFKKRFENHKDILSTRGRNTKEKICCQIAKRAAVPRTRVKMLFSMKVSLFRVASNVYYDIKQCYIQFSLFIPKKHNLI